MSLTITEPIKTIFGMLTKALAAKSQLLYQMQREDLEITAVNDAAGKAFFATAEDPTAILAMGDTVYVATDVYRVGFYTATSVSIGGFGVDDAYISTATGYANLHSGRTGYHIAVDIQDAAGVDYFTKTFQYVPNQAGFAAIDVGPLMVFALSLDATFAFAKEYKLLVTEDWNGKAAQVLWDFTTAVDAGGGDVTFSGVSSSGFTIGEYMATDSILYPGVYLITDVQGTNVTVTAPFNGTAAGVATMNGGYTTTILQAVLAKKQLLDVGGANMWEYLMDETNFGQFLTRFGNPKAWRGWSRTAWFIIDQEAADRTTETDWFSVQNSADINKSHIANIDATSHSLTPSRVQFFPLVETSFAFTEIFIQGVAGGSPLSVSLYYQWENECPEPIMLDWINSKGGVDQWLFAINQQVTYTTGDGTLAERPIDGDIEFITRTKQRFPGANVQRMTLKAEQLTRDQLIALKDIKTTNSLRVYLSKDGANFIDAVIVNIFSTPMQSENNLHEFSVEIEFPDDFDFYAGKLY